jgi:DNA modification methylase
MNRPYSPTHPDNQTRHPNNDLPSSTLQIQQRTIASLKPDPKNPRTHSPRQIKQLVRAIEKFGFTAPILIDANSNVLAGHGRLRAALQLGMTSVPTIELSHLTPAQARAYLVADNKLGLNSDWDPMLLTQHFQELSKLDLDFSLDLTGFSMSEIDVLLDVSAKSDPIDKIPLADPGPPITRPGDIWQLGRHRVLCGNALDRECYVTLMNRKRAVCVITDPPFNLNVVGCVSGLGAVTHREFVMASGEMSRAEFIAFLARVFENLTSVSVDGALHYVFMDHRHIAEIMAAGESAYTELLNLCVWVKDNGGMGSFYRSQHELIFVWKSGNAAHRNNVELGRHGRYRTNVWQCPGANSFSGRSGEEGNLLHLHPTVKPVAMIADAILDCTARGDIVLDPFLGSGTTLLAAERVGRVAYCMEIDPVYVDVAIRRWQRLTGDDAVRADGVTFTEAGVTHG